MDYDLDDPMVSQFWQEVIPLYGRYPVPATWEEAIQQTEQIQRAFFMERQAKNLNAMLNLNALVEDVMENGKIEIGKVRRFIVSGPQLIADYNAMDIFTNLHISLTYAHFAQGDMPQDRENFYTLVKSLPAAGIYIRQGADYEISCRPLSDELEAEYSAAEKLKSIRPAHELYGQNIDSREKQMILMAANAANHMEKIETWQNKFDGEVAAKAIDYAIGTIQDDERRAEIKLLFRHTPHLRKRHRVIRGIAPDPK